MPTTTDIANRALTRIGVKTPDNAVDAAVLSQVTTALSDLHATLEVRGILDWPLSAIPDDSAGLLVDELAWAIRDDFSLPESKKQSLQLAQITARQELYTLSEVADTGEPSEINYF